MSPSYREPTTKREEGSRSIWSTTSIFLALAFLTALMGLLVYSAIQGAGPNMGERPSEIRAQR